MNPDEREFEFRLPQPSPPSSSSQATPSSLPPAHLPLLVTSDRQDIYSVGLVSAIVGAAGYNYKWDRLDRHKTDLEIRLPDVADNLDAIVREPVHPGVHLQVKCSYSCSVHADQTIHYQLDVDTYRFLIDRRGNPRILVLVHVPRPADDGTLSWVELNSEYTILRHRVYWLSLMGKPASSNTDKIVVHVPTVNLFDTRAVHTLVQQLAVQGDKTYAG